jgi:hypothetical protein
VKSVDESTSSPIATETGLHETGVFNVMIESHPTGTDRNKGLRFAAH